MSSTDPYWLKLDNASSAHMRCCMFTTRGRSTQSSETAACHPECVNQHHGIEIMELLASSISEQAMSFAGCSGVHL